MITSLLKFAAKSYMAVVGLVFLTVFTIYLLFAGLIAFVNAVI